MSSFATVVFGNFEWSAAKEIENVRKHGLSFERGLLAFGDPFRLLAVDQSHSQTELRFFCIGMVGERVATVRFTRRARRIRILGAGFWRKGRRLYEEERKKGS